MKIRLDENVSYRVANALKAVLANRPGFEVSWVLDDNPPGTKDPSWIVKFARSDGTAIVSGDPNILQHWPDLIAYTESGLISFFPPPAFQEFKGYGKAAFILRWWPAIIEKVKLSQRGDRWRLPLSWTPDIDSFKRLNDPRLATDDAKRELGIEPISKAHEFRTIDITGLAQP